MRHGDTSPAQSTRLDKSKRLMTAEAQAACGEMMCLKESSPLVAMMSTSPGDRVLDVTELR